VAPQDLLNRWIVPLERRVDYLALHTGKKIEVPFEQLVVFSTNLDEKDLADQAFLRRMGYRARVEPPTPAAYSAIFKRVAYNRGIQVNQEVLDHVLNKYRIERRMMKGCEPRDLMDRVTDICLFEGQSLHLTTEFIDVAWRNYFGTSHSFAPVQTAETMIERTLADPLEL
jgi:chromosomal replication initiation ATPase DnaA